MALYSAPGTLGPRPVAVGGESIWNVTSWGAVQLEACVGSLGPSQGAALGEGGAFQAWGASSRPPEDGTPRREEVSGGAGGDPVNGPRASPWIQEVQGGRSLCLLPKVRFGHAGALGCELSLQKLWYAQLNSRSQGPR